VHLLLGLSSLLLVVIGSYLALGVLRRGEVRSRRTWQLLVLAAPVLSVGLGIAGLLHFSGRSCFEAAPRWDARLSVALVLGMTFIALGATALGLVRHLLLRQVVVGRGLPAGLDVQQRADALATRLGTPCPRVLLCAYDRPLAITCGLFRPTILLSSWMVERLDPHELESVLAHELGHVARRDYLIIWLATVLRDAFFYLPTSWAAYQQLQQEKEIASDDLAVRGTNRPLPLASALAKVWQHLLDGSRLEPAQPLTGAGMPIEDRIARLLNMTEPTATLTCSRASVADRSAFFGLAGVLMIKAPVIVLILAAMGCGPIAAGRSPF